MMNLSKFSGLEKLIANRENWVSIKHNGKTTVYDDIQMVNGLILVPYTTYNILDIKRVTPSEKPFSVTIELSSKVGDIELFFSLNEAMREEIENYSVNNAYITLLRKALLEPVPLYVLVNAINSNEVESYYSILDEHNNIILATEERDNFSLSVKNVKNKLRLVINEETDVRLHAFENACIEDIRVVDVLEDDDYIDFSLEISVGETTNKLCCVLCVWK